MTDGEMIQRAARCAGIELDAWKVTNQAGESEQYLRVRGSPFGLFDPYKSDADAFLVMIGAELQVKATDSVVEVIGPCVNVRYHYQGDRAEATRRAIVDVAAWCA